MSDPPPHTTRWRVHGERDVYDSPWLRLSLLDVETADGHRYEHHAVRATAAAACCIVRSDDSPTARLLLLHRHRVITDAWGWEVPAGRIEPGETPAEAAARETLEETGWQVDDVAEVFDYFPIGGSGDLRFHVTTARALARVAEPDPTETEHLAWFGVDQLAGLVAGGAVREGLTVTALLAVLSGLAAPGVRGPGSSQPAAPTAASPGR